MYSIVNGMCICWFWAYVGAHTGTTGFDIILDEWRVGYCFSGKHVLTLIWMIMTGVSFKIVSNWAVLTPRPYGFHHRHIQSFHILLINLSMLLPISMFQYSDIWFPSWAYPIFPYFSLINLSMFLNDFHVSILGHIVNPGRIGFNLGLGRRLPTQQPLSCSHRTALPRAPP